MQIWEFLYCIFRWIFPSIVDNWSEFLLLTHFKKSYVICLFQQISQNLFKHKHIILILEVDIWLHVSVIFSWSYCSNIRYVPFHYPESKKYFHDFEYFNLNKSFKISRKEYLLCFKCKLDISPSLEPNQKIKRHQSAINESWSLDLPFRKGFSTERWRKFWNLRLLSLLKQLELLIFYKKNILEFSKQDVKPYQGE